MDCDIWISRLGHFSSQCGLRMCRNYVCTNVCVQYPRSQVVAQLPVTCSTVSGRGPGNFLTWVTSRTEQIMRMWTSCKSQTTLPTCIYWSATILSGKIAAHKNYFLLFFQDTVGRTSHTSTVSWCCHAKLIHGLSNDTEYRALALACCCHPKPLHGACKKHTVQVWPAFFC